MPWGLEPFLLTRIVNRISVFRATFLLPDLLSARRIKFELATINGIPVPMAILLEYYFNLY